VPIRLLLDEHLPTVLSSSLRTAGIDAVHVIEAGWRGVEDEALLGAAAANGRVLVTADVSHFPEIARQWAAQERHHAGLIIVPRAALPVGELLRRLIATCRTWDVSQPNQVVFLAARRPLSPP